jgi:hypothetical protein
MTLIPTPTSGVGTAFDVVLADGSRESVQGADAYQQESSMTTFFRTGNGRQAVDCWSVRVASFRTDHIVAIRRCEADAGAVRHLHPA